MVGSQSAVALASIALAVDVTPVKAVSFFIFMGATGFILGWLLGDEYRLLPGLGGSAPQHVPEDLERKAESAIERLTRGEPAPEIGEIIAATRSPNEVAALFPGQRVQRLVALLQDAPPADQA